MKRLVVAVATLVLAGIAGGVAVSAGLPLADQIASALMKRDDAADTIHSVATVDSEEWALRSYPNQRGDKCIRQTVPGEAIGTTCLDAATMFADGREVVVMPGARQRSGATRKLTWDNMWLHGVVSPRVSTLEVVNMDCSVVKVAFDDDGVFMHVVGKAAIERDVIPHKVLARNEAGTVIYEREIGFGLSDNGKAAGLKPPRPKPECA